MTDTLTRNPFTTANVTEDAAAAINERPDFWTGHSGETITGTETADFLQATKVVLERRGWARTFADDPELPELDESMSLKAMVLTLWRWAREALAKGPLTLMYAMHEVNDSDTSSVATKVLDRLVAARAGVESASANAWAGRCGRTWEQVADLLDAGADFARTHGPATPNALHAA